MDFLDRMKNYIEVNCNLYVPHLQVGLLSDGDSIAIRPTPSPPPGRYLDKSKTPMFSFQILTKHKNAKTAYDTLQSITEKLDDLGPGAIVSNDGSFIFTKCEVYTSPNFVEKASTGETIFTALFQAELSIERGE